VGSFYPCQKPKVTSLFIASLDIIGAYFIAALIRGRGYPNAGANGASRKH
jgi:hypothetical protein